MSLLATLRSRRTTNAARWVIDNLLPPIVSDARWFNRILARAMFGGRHFDLDFRERALAMSPAELAAAYARFGDANPWRESDTTAGQRAFVVASVVGTSVLEVGCGNGVVAAALARRGLAVTATDLKAALLSRVRQRHAGDGLRVGWGVAFADRLPFADGAFDTVVTTHTLEHIPDLRACVAELRRVAARAIVIVVPCQKYKRYTIDTHVHFFPTEAVLRFAMGLEGAQVERVDGDWCLRWLRPDR